MFGDTLVTADSVGFVATLFGGATAFLALVATARGWYRRTFGRRLDRYRRLARLGTGAQLSFFVSVLGEPPAIQRTVVKDDYVELVPLELSISDPGDGEYELQEQRSRRAFTESVFIDRDYYAQTITDDDETICAFSVTTRSPRFRPVFEGRPRLGFVERRRWKRQVGAAYEPLVHIQLGRTTFADLDSDDPESFRPPHFIIAVGAHNHVYSELDAFGNPGHYQWFAWTASDAARHGRFGNGPAVMEEVGGDEWPHPEKEDQPEWDDMPETRRFRRETVITTYTVVNGLLLWEQNYPLGRFGPHENDVRTLP
jgi:hypothetical protein